MEDDISPLALEETRGENARRRRYEAPLFFPLKNVTPLAKIHNASHHLNHKTTVSFVRCAIL